MPQKVSSEQTRQASHAATTPADDFKAHSFLDDEHSIFAPRVKNAANANGGDGSRLYAGPLVDYMERSHAVSRGLETLFRIMTANELQQCQVESADDPASEDQPLSKQAIFSLAELGRAAAGMLAEEAERIADWADAYGVREDQQ